MKLDVGVEYQESFEIEIRNPLSDDVIRVDGEPFTVELRSPTSDGMRINADEAADRLAIRNAKKKRLVTPQGELRPVINKRLAFAHKAWRNVPVEGDQPECNQKNALEMIEENDWYRDQVAEALGEEKNSMKETLPLSPKSSSPSSKGK